MFARFNGVPFGSYTIKAKLVSTTSSAPEGRRELPFEVTKAKIDPTSKQVEVNLKLEPVHSLSVRLVDPFDGTVVSIGGGTVELSPLPVATLDPEAHVFEIVPGTAYRSASSW